jgi:cysteine desulfurase
VIYLDYNATTPLDPRVLEAMLPYFTTHFGNASSVDHLYGAEAERAVKQARGQVADLIGCEPAEIVFTSGATEADNLAVLGCAAYAGGDAQVVVSAIEHPAVLESAATLGRRAVIAPVTNLGVVDAAQVERLMGEPTALVSVMAANNETGAVQPLADIASACREAGVPFHTDAVQAAARMPLDVDQIDCDLMSLSAHKMYGPKGVGALYVRRRGRRTKLCPILYGGAHERSLRGGTLNVPAIVGFGAAADLVRREGVADWQRERNLRDTLIGMLRQVNGAVFNVPPDAALPQTLSVRFDLVAARALMHRLRERVAMSAGSACATLSSEPSHALLAQGLTEDDARRTVRISFGRFTTHEEIVQAAAAINEGVQELQLVASAA